jgi:MtN3 and saliva related transmembrane protein
MMSLETVVGFVAAFCTTVSYIPQVRKCWQTGSAGDLSLKMLATLGMGVALWVAYGFMKGDPVIIMANGISLLLLAFLLVFKVRENARDRQTA